MKGIQGLVIAIVLGLIGAAVNFHYISQKAKIGDTVDFLIVHTDKKVKRGQTFKDSDLATVRVPLAHARALSEIAYQGSLRANVIGTKATRDYGEGDLILDKDIATPPPADATADDRPDAIRMGFPVDTRSFEPDFVTPGRTQVSFLLPRMSPTPGNPKEVGAEPEVIGPFDVYSVGSRRGSIDTMIAHGIRPGQDNTLTIWATFKNRQLDKNALRVWEYLARTGRRPLEVIIHPERPETASK